MSRPDVASLTGRVSLVHSTCRTASVAWELTVAGQVVDGVLTADDRSAELDVAAAQPWSEVRLRARRIDTTNCACELRWDDPGLGMPAFSLPF